MGEAKLRSARAEYSVGICFPCGWLVPWQTCMSLTRTAHLLARLDVPVNIHAIAGSSDVVLARNAVLTNFLADHEQFLFWIDSDISWVPEDFVRVLRLAKQLGVVCAAYPLKREPVECIINQVDPGAKPNEFGLVEVLSTGLGFTCVRRDIIDAFAATKEQMYHSGNDRMLIDAFRRDKKILPDGRKSGVGEDVAFFDDLRALGHKIWLDTTISLEHIGPKAYRVPMVPLNDTPEISNDV